MSLDENHLKIYAEAVEGHSYVMTVDTARGRGLDSSAFSVIDVTSYPFTQVATYNSAVVSPLQYPNIINHVGLMYNEAAVVVETNDIGESVVNSLNYELEYPNIISGDAKKYSLGVRTTVKVKSVGCSNMKDLVESQKLIVCDPLTIKELTGFISKGASYEADAGFHDDMVMTLVLFAWFTTTTDFQNIKTDFNLARDIYGSEMDQFENMLPGAILNDGLEPETPVVVLEDGERWELV